MGVVMARCARCERLWRVVVYAARGRRLRHQVSRCCGARMRRAWHHPPSGQFRP
jgi:hypothetical protein